MDIQTITEAIRVQFGVDFFIYEKRPGVYQFSSSIYHEDGDAFEIYLVPENDDTIKITDFGMTVMRLSYYYELDTDRKNEIFNKIVRENRANVSSGSIEIVTKIKSLFPSIMQMAQVIAKVSNMRYFKREVIENLFYEMLEEFVMEGLSQYKPVKAVSPLDGRQEYEVDFELRPNGVPYYLFGIKDTSKARLATIACQQFSLSKLSFKSMAVYSDIDKIGKKDRDRLINASDKQYTSIDEFKAAVVPYIERELRSHEKNV